MDDFLKDLNKSQLEAVLYTDGPQLVIAGAGSGKTRVLTYKIAYLLSQGLPPQSILALTFTNKAAREMKERIGRLTDIQTSRHLWMGTFHSIFSRILRYESEAIGFPSNFTIYDSSDSKSLQKSIMKEMQLDDKVYRPGMIQSRISRAKNALITPNIYGNDKDIIQQDNESHIPLMRDIFQRYQNRCEQAAAMDFDDLLLKTYLLFKEHPDILEKYSHFFQYVLVDEYQDTNYAQHRIIQQLCSEMQHITVVGDDAQSIYSFRGANIDNILQFRNIYSGCKIFKLERNYRSTQNIVDAANSLIHKNSGQIEKTVYSEKERGSKICISGSYSDYEEGYAVVGRISDMMRHHYHYSDFVILYRTNAQSRIFEEALRKRGIPYKIYGGLSFYQRSEVKDIIAYLRMIVNPDDEEAFKRVIKFPPRGIGDTTVLKLLSAATDFSVSLWTIICNPSAYKLNINSGTTNKLIAFRDLIQSFIDKELTLNAAEIAQVVIKESGIVNLLYQDTSVEGISKQENMLELIKGISEFCEIHKEEGSTNVRLADFLSEVSLLTDQDNDKDENADKVTLMTVHAAKGLEFTNVFVAGMEEELFPSAMSLDSPRAIEEERRLFYVAITRAQENCIITFAKSRYRNGQTHICTPSRFLRDIDAKYLEIPEDAPANTNIFPIRERFSEPEFHAKETVDKPIVEQHQRLQRIIAPNKRKDNEAPTAQVNSVGITVGSHVQHNRFGDGVVTSIEGNGTDAIAAINFTHFGEKHLLLKYAKLTVL